MVLLGPDFDTGICVLCVQCPRIAIWPDYHTPDYSHWRSEHPNISTKIKYLVLDVGLRDDILYLFCQ